MLSRPIRRPVFHLVVGLFAVSLHAASITRSDPLAREYSHRVWRVQDGLPQNAIRVISQTSDGYLWIGSPGGLVRFDGSRFFVFDRSNTPAFRDESILALCPAADGSLWIGLEGGGLLRYQNQSFRAYGPAEGLTNGFVRALYEDRSGILWIGTDRGFFRLVRGKIERLDGQGTLPITAVTGISAGQDGTIWVAAGVGMLTVEGGQVHRVLSEGKPVTGVRSVYPRSNGEVWFSTAAGVQRLDGSMVHTDPRLEGVRALTMCDDHGGNLWIGTLGGGLVRVGANGVAFYRASRALPDTTIAAIFEDREQNLWVGTHDGLLRLNKSLVETFTREDGLADDNVSTIYDGRNGLLWITTITGQIYRREHGTLSLFRLPDSLSHVHARTVFEDSKGALWIGTEDEGLIRVAGGAFTHFTTRDGLRNNNVRVLHEDRRGDLWIALGSGLSRWDGTRFHSYYVEDGLAYGSVRVLAEDHKGDLLVGTDGGLNRVHDGRFVVDPNFAPLAGERIWALHEDSDSTLWVGTRGGGLFRIAEGKLSRFTTREGLLSNTIYRILEDGNRNLWWSGPAGVFSASRDELKRVAEGLAAGATAVPSRAIAGVAYGTAEGLESTQMNGGFGLAGCRTSMGEIWFPSVKGAVRIDPNLARASKPSPVLIEAITADDRAIPLSGDIQIRPGHGKLEIHYTACSLLSPERTRFQYRLEGFDEGWTAGSSDRVAHYTNLPHGQYRFRVVATDSVAPQQASEAAVSFTWDPHLYETAWFYGLCAAIAMACVAIGLRLYARQTRARYALLLSERTRLAREMHDTVIQGCVGVSTLLEAASAFPANGGGPMKELLDQARVHIRLTLDEARQAVWDLRHAELEGELAGMLRDFVRQLSIERNVQIRVDLSGAPVHLESGAARSMFLVAREAVRNAVTHAESRLISIRLCFDADEVRLEVVDDGRGFTPPNRDLESGGHYGILGMRERVEQLGGSFLLHSTPGGGTAVVARLPLRGRVLRQEPERVRT
ncbi:MAG TPA: two-component regulator propeller domain-containing protein [Bryobacteraceae bacterium]|nr:two-component regulator propeller domain-containing protein [Bryobacteraceae bacterium]